MKVLQAQNHEYKVHPESQQLSYKSLSIIGRTYCIIIVVLLLASLNYHGKNKHCTQPHSTRSMKISPSPDFGYGGRFPRKKDQLTVRKYCSVRAFEHTQVHPLTPFILIGQWYGNCK